MKIPERKSSNTLPNPANSLSNKQNMLQSFNLKKILHWLRHGDAQSSEPTEE